MLYGIARSVYKVFILEKLVGKTDDRFAEHRRFTKNIQFNLEALLYTAAPTNFVKENKLFSFSFNLEERGQSVCIDTTVHLSPFVSCVTILIA